METIEAINRKRLAILIKEAGSQAALAARVGKSASQISQWLNGSKDSRSGKPRGMERDTKRLFEARCGKPSGWMDYPMPEEGPISLTGVSEWYVRVLADLETLLPRERERFIREIKEAADYVREIRATDSSNTI